MRIGIYAKWLNSLGGGEKVATVMAETLAYGNNIVDLISNTEIEKSELESKMNVDLSHVNLVFWTERRYEKLERLTINYDVFINASFFDHLPSKAKRSIYYVHFPTPIKRTLFGFLKYETLLPFLRRVLIIPEFSGGVERVDEIHTRRGKWLKNVNTIILNNPGLVSKIVFRIFAENIKINSLSTVNFSSPNSEVKIMDKYIDHKTSVLVFHVTAKLKHDENLIIKIHTNDEHAKNSFGLVSLTVLDMRYIFWNLIKRFMPSYEMALYGSSLYKPAQGIDTYHKILSNSKFTKYWVRKYWDKESQVLYPPVEMMKSAKNKQKIILNVGRFFVGGHSKRQDVLISAFKLMIDRKKIDDGWELHFVGGLASGKDHSDFLNRIRKKAKNYPVYFHLFASFKKLKDLYSKATIYWHATGYEKNEEQEPITLEHFGISVVESMSAGCVPVVFSGGGVAETMGDDSELVWKKPNELIRITEGLIKDNKKLKKLSRLFVEKAKDFSKKNFVKNLLTEIKNVSGNTYEKSE